MSFNCKRYTAGLLLFAMSMLLFGCGGGTSPSAPPTSIISGKTSLDGVGLDGVTVTISGAGSNSKNTVDGGTYSFTGLPNGGYTITPSIAGYTFFPASRTITVANGNVTIPEFTATAISSSFTVSGRVVLDGTGLQGVTVTITGAGTNSVTTDVTGNYLFAGVVNGNCTITPSIEGYTFNSISQVITVNNGDVAVPDFTATATSGSSVFTVSGKVTLNGTSLAGVDVSIALPGGFVIGTLTTGESGIYTFTGVLNGNYTVTPSLAGYTFTQANSTFSVNNGNITGQDFTATPTNTGSIIFTF